MSFLGFDEKPPSESVHPPVYFLIITSRDSLSFLKYLLSRHCIIDHTIQYCTVQYGEIEIPLNLKNKEEMPESLSNIALNRYSVSLSGMIGSREKCWQILMLRPSHVCLHSSLALSLVIRIFRHLLRCVVLLLLNAEYRKTDRIIIIIMHRTRNSNSIGSAYIFTKPLLDLLECEYQ